MVTGLDDITSSDYRRASCLGRPWCGRVRFNLRASLTCFSALVKCVDTIEERAYKPLSSRDHDPTCPGLMSVERFS